MTPQQEALELCSVVELYDELEKRFDQLIIVAVQARPTPEDPSHEQRFRRFKGHPYFCLGLAADMAYRLHVDMMAEETRVPDDSL